MTTRLTTVEKWLYIVMILGIVAAALTLLTLVMPANAAEGECLSSDVKVRAVHGEGAWAGRSRHVEGHEGQRCYFLGVRPSDRVAHHQERRHDRRAHAKASPVEVVAAVAPVPPSPPVAAAVQVSTMPLRTLSAVTALDSDYMFNKLGVKAFKPFDASPWSCTGGTTCRYVQERAHPSHGGWKDTAFVVGTNGGWADTAYHGSHDPRTFWPLI